MARTGRRSGLGTLTTGEIYKELRRRERKTAAMVRRRDRAAARLDALDEQIRLMGGTVNGAMRGGGRRPRNETNLAEALSRLLKGKTMRVKDMVDAVQRAGYKTSAANFRTIVNQTLIKNKSMFKKVGRGEYTAS